MNPSQLYDAVNLTEAIPLSDGSIAPPVQPEPLSKYSKKAKPIGLNDVRLELPKFRSQKTNQSRNWYITNSN